MALFPTSPANGETANVDGIQYTYSSSQTAWVRSGTFVGNAVANTVTASGNITANFFIGNGSQLTGITTSSSSISNGNSNVNIPSANGNVNISAVGNANVLVVTGTGANIAGTLNATGNVTVGNLITGAGIGGNISGANVVTANTFVGALTGAATSATTAGTVTTAAQPNITSVGTLTSLIVGNATANTTFGNGIFTATGNANVNNLGTAQVLATANVTAPQLISNVATGTAPLVVSSTTLVSNLNADLLDGFNTATANTANTVAVRDASGNLAANFFIGNGSQLTGIITSVSNVSNGNSNLNIPAANGNINLSVAGNANVLVVTGTGVNVAGTLNATGNITGGNLLGPHANGNSNVNIPAANGNINLTAVGNTTLVITGTGANFTGTLGVSSNANVGNLGTAGLIVATGNVSGGNLTTGGVVLATGNVTGGNLTTAGLVSATGNVSGGNLTTGGVLSVTGTGVSSIAGNLDMTSNTIINLATPTNPQDAATKQYVDDIAQGLHTHDSCNAATNTTLAIISGGTVTYNNGTSGVGATLTVSGGTFTTIDGVTLSNGMRILVKNESNPAHNGIYDRTSTTVLTRSSDFDTSAEMAGGDFTFVSAGTEYDNTGWVMTDPVTTVGITNVVWVQFSGAGTYTAGTGLVLNGSVFSIANTAVTAATYGNGDRVASFTVNAQGQLTNAANTVIAANAANLTGTTLNSGIVTSSLTTVGTLGTLSVTGNANVGNLGTGGLIVATGNVTGGNLVTGGALSVTGNANVGNLGTGRVIATGNISGTQLISNIATGTAPLVVTSTTQVANLNVATAGAATNAAAVQTNASTATTVYPTFVTAATNANYALNTVSGISANLSNNSITATTFVGSLSGTATSATTAGTVTTNAQPNITSVSTSFTGLTLVANGNITLSGASSQITGANLVSAGFFSGNGSSITAINANSIASGTLAQARLANSNIILGNTTLALGTTTTTVTGLTSVTSTTFVGALTGAATTAGTVTTNAQGNITSVGTLTGLTIGNATANAVFGNGTITLNSGLITGNGAGLSQLAGANVTGTVANATFATSAGTATTAGTANTTQTLSNGAYITGDSFNGGTARTWAVDATTTNTANKVVARDANGSFSANIITATLSGSATSAGTATTAGTVTTNAQPNITSVSTSFTGLTFAANGNITMSGTLSQLSGANLVSAGFFSGNGASITGINANSIASGTLAQARLANSSLTVNGTSIALGGSGTVTANTTQILTLGSYLTGTSFNGGTAVTAAVDATTTNTANKVVARDTNGSFSANIITATLSGAATTAGTVTTAAQGNITSVGTLSSLAVTGTATAGNLSTGGTLSATGNANVGNIGATTAIFTTGNITTINSGLLQNGTSNVVVAASGGNVTLGVAGTAIIIATSTGANITGTGNITGNANVGNLGTAGLVLATGNVTGGNLTTGGVVLATGNVSGGNITTAGVVAATGNVTGGNLTTGGVVAATGNVSGGNLTTAGVLTVTGTGVSSIAGNLDMTSNTIINLATPTNPQDAATKQYVDDIAQGLHTHDSCNAATSTTLATISGGTVTYNNGASGVGANLTTTGTFTTIDGVTLSNGMRILVKNEANTAHNGIYDRTSTTVLTRSSDFDTSAEMAGGDFTFVSAGTEYDNTGWVMTDPVTTVGTSAVTWVQFSGAGTYTAGTGLTLTGSQFSVNASQTQITSVGTLGSLAVTANANVGNLGTAGLVVATGNVTGGNLVTGGVLSVSGNANTGNLGTATAIITTGNITTINSGLMQNGNSNIVITANGNVTVSAVGGARITATSTGANVTGTLGVSGNANVGNIGAAAGVFTTVAGSLTTAAQGNITSVGTLTSVNTSGNINFTGAAASDTATIYAEVVSATTNLVLEVSDDLASDKIVLRHRYFLTSNTVDMLSAQLSSNTESNVTVTGNLIATNRVIATGNISGTQLISNIATGTAPLVVTSTTQVANLNVATAGSVTTNAQGNITSVGTLTGLTVSGILTSTSTSGIRVEANDAQYRLTTSTGRGWRLGTTSTGNTHGRFYIQGSTDGFVSSFITAIDVDTAGNVGIGTSAPKLRLQVTGAASAEPPTLGVASGTAYVTGNDINYGLLTGIRSTGDAWLQAQRTDATATAYNILLNPSGGNVGIGVTPTAKLHVAGTIQSSSGSTTAQMFADGGAAYFASVGAFPSIFLTNGAERMRITANGDVGIGTSSPGSKLDVASTTDGDTIRVSFPSAATGSTGGGIQFRAYTNSATLVEQGRIQTICTDGSASYGGAMRFMTAGSGALAERMRIDSSGNVGIGTTAPGYKLEVNGSFAATTKSFVIDHPTKPGMKLRYGSLEGPENGVYVRGRLRAGETVISLPDYWEGLVDQDTYTVNLTPVGKHQELFVRYIADDYIVVGGKEGEEIDCFYTVFAERKDVEKLVVEF